MTMAMVIGPTCRCMLLVQGIKNGEICLANRMLKLGSTENTNWYTKAGQKMRLNEVKYTRRVRKIKTQRS
jgi:hypothetical protein